MIILSLSFYPPCHGIRPNPFGAYTVSRKNSVNVSSLEAHAAGGFVTGYGHYNMKDGYFNIHAVAEDCSLAQLPVESAMAGTVSGSLIAEGMYINGELLSLQASAAWASKDETLTLFL